MSTTTGTGGDVSTPARIVGQCRTMCPTAEVAFRQQRGLLSRFELADPTKNPRPKRGPPPPVHCAVKEYSRPTADQAIPTPESLRPAPVLMDTVTHLMIKIMGKHGLTVEVYNFIFDRLRAVRKDIVYQGLTGPTTQAVLLTCFRFSALASVALHNQPGFEAHHNLIAMKELLLTMKEQTRIPAPVDDTYAATVAVLDALFYLGDPRALPTVSTGTRRAGAEGEDPHKRPTEAPSALVEWAASVVQAYTDDNYVLFFRLVESSPSWLFQALLQRHAPAFRTRALATMVTAYATKVAKFPLKDLATLMGLQSPDDAKAFCAYHGIAVDEAAASALFRPGVFTTRERPWDGASSLIPAFASATVGKGPVPSSATMGQMVLALEEEAGL
eukprot:m.22869 g.22869  ORF g.22869 m.22869 type:complete len:386 (+) comp4037_c0_seq1:100-1257(+)